MVSHWCYRYRQDEDVVEDDYVEGEWDIQADKKEPQVLRRAKTWAVKVQRKGR